MAINDQLKLSSPTLEGLYRNSLYYIEEQSSKTAQPLRKETIKKMMTILTGSPINMEKENPSFLFLTGIVQACRLTIADTNFFSSHNDEVNFKYIQDNAPSPLVLMFDITPGDIGLPVYFPHFQLQHFSGVTYLSAPDLPALQEDKLLKSKLWLCLKQYFSI